jgi:hypothetical protein
LNDVNQPKGTPVELASGLEIKLEREVVKEALKEGISDWLDEKYRVLGKYTARAFAAAVFAAVVYFILWAGGWHSPLAK